MKQLALSILLFFVCGPAFAEHAPRPDLPYFFQVNAGLFRGGRPTQTGLEKLAQLGVRTVINLQGGDLDSKMRYMVGKLEKGEFPDAIRKEGEAVLALQMNYLSYPLNAIDPVTSEESLIIAQILKDLQDPLLKPIYIHCEHGKDRTGLLVALERVRAESWDKEAAKNEWFRMGHGTISKLFTHELDRYFDGFNFAVN